MCGSGSPGHLLDAVCAVVLIVHITCHILEVVHVSADKHVAQLYEVAVCLILHYGAEVGCGWATAQGTFPPSTWCPMHQLTLHDSPGVQSPPDPLPLGFHHCVAANNSEGSTLLREGSKGSRPVHMSAGLVVGGGMGAQHPAACPSSITIIRFPPKTS